MRKYASVLDRQPEVRTKVSEEMYDRIEGFAALHRITEYRAVRMLIDLGLQVVENRLRS